VKKRTVSVGNDQGLGHSSSDGNFTAEVFVFDLKANDITPLRTNTGALLVPDTSTKLNWIP